ncbi:MAG TPA: methyltransferase domain-containing protein [Polyangiaceae bacterium]|jgi:2-polyprenyl-3-methyl-5-hydroxy-6-metoxy-1,4-benzoquinol methylase
MMSTAEKTSTFFDRYAHDFSAIYGTRNTMFHSVVNKLFRESMKLRFFMTLEGCNPVTGRSVLDVGCGPGHYGVALARRGASRVLGVDFAPGMLEIARDSARRAGVASQCTFEQADFVKREFGERFDYVVAMGFMDYMERPREVVEKALSVCDVRSFFSFPLDGGVLAWQRRVRYKSRCDLYLYGEEQVRSFFDGTRAKKVDVEVIARDLFVTAHV